MLFASSVYPEIIYPGKASSESHPLGRAFRSDWDNCHGHTPGSVLRGFVSEFCSVLYKKYPQQWAKGGKMSLICLKKCLGGSGGTEVRHRGPALEPGGWGLGPKNDFKQIVKSPALQKGTANCRHRFGVLPASLLLCC